MSKHKWTSFGGQLFQTYYPVRGKHRKANQDNRQRSPHTYLFIAQLDKERRSWQSAEKDGNHIPVASIVIQWNGQS